MKSKHHDGVVPPTPIINRRTGAETQFGPRHAFDSFYVLELLRATGCTAEEAAIVTRVLQPLLDNCGGFTVNDLLGMMRLYYAHDECLVDEDGGRPSSLRAVDDGVITYLDFRPKKEK
jgi:hypothetical protein